MRLAWIGLPCAVLATVASASATVPPVPAEPQSETIDYDHAADRRMTVPVIIGGRGPFPFIVDTGSERTVIARELAETLGLDPSHDIMLTSIIDVRRVPTVIIPRLDLGRRTVDVIQAPALARADLGAEGVLGIDALEDQQIILDFARRQITLSRAEPEQENWPRNTTIVVRARNRFGRLVLADAELDGTRVYAIVDTGSSISIGNDALRRRLIRRRRMDPDQSFELTAVTGATMQINYTIAERLEIGGIVFNALPVAFAETELFRQLDLVNRPAMLLGMDVLRLFDRVSIDFANRRIRMQMPNADMSRRQDRALPANRLAETPAPDRDIP
ncbi:aspartyl protease family protein [Parasphingopyxis marina]|uniref:Aspartyl protease family protein n=1 Tax=Parasphingopyxis marina TaxID=2761622 RepID=A0A842HXR1_9SPHN|nr:aspartyl protease family protein [Parasphingopyxis marina]MBC2777732.1 aspartyl protease family protein [Parasphingopyxis marina]